MATLKKRIEALEGNHLSPTDIIGQIVRSIICASDKAVIAKMVRTKKVDGWELSYLDAHDNPINFLEYSALVKECGSSHTSVKCTGGIGIEEAIKTKRAMDDGSELPPLHYVKRSGGTGIAESIRRARHNNASPVLADQT